MAEMLLPAHGSENNACGHDLRCSRQCGCATLGTLWEALWDYTVILVRLTKPIFTVGTEETPGFVPTEETAGILQSYTDQLSKAGKAIPY